MKRRSGSGGAASARASAGSCPAAAVSHRSSSPGHCDRGTFAVAFDQHEADDLELEGPHRVGGPRPAQPRGVQLMDQRLLGGQEHPLRETAFMHHRDQMRPVAQFAAQPPHEYLDRQVFICATNTKRRELAQRYEIGVDNILWGSDFPHPEGTWPNTREWLANTFHDIPVAETRRMLGLAAAEVFGFDTDAAGPDRPPHRPDPGGTGPECRPGGGRGVLGALARGRPALADGPRLPGPGGRAHDATDPTTATPSSRRLPRRRRPARLQALPGGPAPRGLRRLGGRLRQSVRGPARRHRRPQLELRPPAGRAGGGRHRRRGRLPQHHPAVLPQRPR